MIRVNRKPVNTGKGEQAKDVWCVSSRASVQVAIQKEQIITLDSISNVVANFLVQPSSPTSSQLLGFPHTYESVTIKGERYMTVVPHKRVTDHTNTVKIGFCWASGSSLPIYTSFAFTSTTPFSKTTPSQTWAQLAGEWQNI